MATKESDIPIKAEKHPITKRRKLEDCEPGASRKEVLQFIEKVAASPKTSRKRG
jgi:hypothetical protein